MRVRILTALVICGLAASAARAQSDVLPPLPDRNPVRLGMALPPKPIPPGEEPTVPWTDAEISAAKEACKELLKEETVDYDELLPIKEGICGAPAPILVRSISHDPKVVIDPPATMSCPMAKELSVWLKDQVQPIAKRLLNTTVVGLHNATSYACRNRYGSATAPLSEHALANALDVSDFVLASGGHITVLDSWPKVLTAAATDQAKPKDGQPAKADDGSDGGKVALTHAKADPALPAPVKEASHPAKPDRAKSNPAKSEEAKPDRAKSNPAQPEQAKSSPAQPDQAKSDPAKPEEAEPAKPDPKSEFVIEVHDGACKEFGTVLGPAANAAHKNHFHLDMKTRKRASFCQ